MPIDKSSTDRKLLKILGVSFGIAVTIGGTIGTGILRKPGLIAAQLHSHTLIMGAWVAVSLYALLGTLCAIELGTSLPKAGAWYVYAQRAFGNYAGFVVGINSWLGTCAATAFGFYTMSEYTAMLVPAIEPYIPYIAVAYLLMLSSLHWIGLSVASSFQNVMSFVKAVGLFGFVAICYIYGKDVSLENVGNTTHQIAQNPFSWAALIFSMQAIFYTYDGWHTAAYFAEEDANPSRNLPKSMLGGVLLIIAIYLLCNLAILHVLPTEILENSKLAATDAVKLIFGEKSGKIITFFLMISILGILNAQLLFNPRVLYSMSRDGLFFPQGTRVNKGGTPSLVMPLTALIATLLIISGKQTCERLSDIATFFFVLGYVSGFASLIKLRIAEPNLLRPWKVPFYPFIPIIMLLASLAFLIGAISQDIQSSQYALFFLVVSYPVFRLVERFNRQK